MGLFFGKFKDSTSKKHKAKAVERATKSALVKYEKTLKDLAAYDRGEEISLSR